MSTFPAIKLRGLKSSISAPGVGFGVGTAHYKQDVRDIVVTAIKAGYRHIDGAEMYANEESMGAGIVDSGVKRDELFITTKVAGEASLKNIGKALDESLRKLQTDYVDLYLIHTPTQLGKNGVPELATTWKEMEKALEQGKARSIGVSNFRVSDLRKLEGAKHVPSTNQIELHPYVLKASLPLLAYMKEKGIVAEAYGPTTAITTFAGGPVDAVVDKIAANLESRNGGNKVEPGQVMLKYLAQKDVLLVTTSSKDWRMKQQLAAGAIGDLTDDEMRMIDEAGAKQHKRKFMPHMDDDSE